MNFIKSFKFLVIFFVLLSFFLYILFSLSLGNNSLQFIKQLIPETIKTQLKNTVFFLPRIINENKSLKLNQKKNKIIKDLFVLNKINKLEFISEDNIFYTEKKINFKIRKWVLPFWSYANANSKNVAHIDNIDDGILLVTGNGKFISFSNKNIKDNEPLKPKVINSNIKELIKDSYFYTDQKHAWISVKDLLVSNSHIYISYTKAKFDRKCYNTEILSGKIRDNYIKFEPFFSYENCNYLDNQYSSESNIAFNAHQSGGRIIDYKDNFLLFSIGDFRKREDAQNMDSNLGKILMINKKTRKSSIFSLGHRNPQGLIYLKNKDIIISTEHGPLGGDEINKIIETKNYGWPISSYGEHYGYKTDTGIKNSGIIENNIYTFYPLHKSHKDYGFEEPIHYFIPSIGISELIEIPEQFSKDLSGNVFITSLSGYGNGLSIFDVRFNSSFDKIDEINKIKIGERIRDIVYSDSSNSFFLVLENSPAIAELKIIK